MVDFMKRKQNILVGAVILGILAIVLIIMMMTTRKGDLCT